MDSRCDRGACSTPANGAPQEGAPNIPKGENRENKEKPPAKRLILRYIEGDLSALGVLVRRCDPKMVTDALEKLETKCLVLRCREGDASACAELVDRYEPMMLGNALEKLENREEAFDAVQDSWVSIFGQLDRLNFPEAFKAWANTIAVRKCVRIIRKNERQRNLVEKSLVPEEHSADNEAGWSQQTVDLLEEATGDLPSDQRSVIELYYFDDLSVVEIAEKESIPEGTVQSRLYYGRMLNDS